MMHMMVSILMRGRIDMNEPANMCEFPCENPEKEAERKGFPPVPPPLRKPPRHIPGFPETSADKSRYLEIDNDAEQHPLEYLAARKRRGLGAMSKSTINDHINVDHEGDDLLNPPYKIHNHAAGSALSSHTMNTDLKHSNGLWEYDTHNVYGTSELTIIHDEISCLFP